MKGRDHQALLVTCQGASGRAQRATRTAALLEACGAAVHVQEIDAAIGPARRGRRIVTLDGCPSACSAHRLQVMALEPFAALNLVEVCAAYPEAENVDLARIAQRIAPMLQAGLRGGRRRSARAYAGGQAAPRASARADRHQIADYLLAIDALSSRVLECGALAVDAPVRTADVHRLLGVSRVTAWEMLSRLRERALTETAARGELVLTARGRAAADEAIVRHRLIERMVCDLLGYPPAQAHRRASSLARAFDEDVLRRVRDALGDPQRCPHGWPIDPVLARREARELSSLAALREGQRAVVVRLGERCAATLEALCRLGIEPGRELAVLAPASSQETRVRLDGGLVRQLPRSTAEATLVHRLAEPTGS